MMTLVRCARAIVQGSERRDYAFLVENGRISECGNTGELAARYPDAEVQSHGEEVIVVPGFVNGHSHAYQILLRGWADDLPFARWRKDALYRVVPQLTPQQIYDTFVVAFDEMLGAGITTVAEFFYLNGAGNAHAEAAIRAARDTGIRLVFARTWMDASYAPPEFRESIDDAQQRTDALMRQYPEANVCVAPHSLHAASHDMIRAAHAFAREKDCMFHIHVAEAPYEGRETLEKFDATPVRLLEKLGVLDERTIAIHAIYVDAEEKALLGRRNARVVHNAMTNQYLGDGICDVVGLRENGVIVGLGTDADVKPSLIEEMRAAALLQKLRALDGSALGAARAFEMATAEGARALGFVLAGLISGAFADYVTIEASGIDAWSPPLNALVYRGENAWVRETYVGGRRVRERVRSERSETSARALAAILPLLHLP
ncbi:MAG: amidohydrolase family protein [Candidatus Eremiobacteraeota bacterium]|nr:amidohydrolase family protein [Candidatus Eremiobacteraeota bacterium]